MQRLRAERVDHLKPLLMAEKQRLKEWQRRGLEQLKAESSGRKLRSDEARRLQDAEEHIQRQIRARDEWIKAGMATSELPYLRLVLVLVLVPSSDPAFGGAASGRQSRNPSGAKAKKGQQ
jgi:hypothetical protein